MAASISRTNHEVSSNRALSFVRHSRFPLLARFQRVSSQPLAEIRSWLFMIRLRYRDKCVSRVFRISDVIPDYDRKSALTRGFVYVRVFREFSSDFSSDTSFEMRHEDVGGRGFLRTHVDAASYQEFRMRPRTSRATHLTVVPILISRDHLSLSSYSGALNVSRGPVITWAGFMRVTLGVSFSRGRVA